MTEGEVGGWLPVSRCHGRLWVAGALAVVTICMAGPGWGASRLGGETDDSVCDTGRTQERSREGARAADFVRTQCRNGQLLMGTSVVPAGGFDSEILGLAKVYCRIADIQAKRILGGSGPFAMEFEEVRCRIEKLPK